MNRSEADKLGKVIETKSRQASWGVLRSGYVVKLTEDRIVYKKVRDPETYTRIRATLLLPKGTNIICARYSEYLRGKFRANQAKVISLLKVKSKRKVTKAVSLRKSSFVYKVGKMVKPEERFSRDCDSECNSGIHFYFSAIEADLHK